jgi:hypothetical protein
MKRFSWAAAALIAATLIAGCGGNSSPAASDSSATTPATTTQAPHTAQPGEPALLPVSGYDYQAAPADLETQMATVQQQTKQFYKNYSVHVVTKDGQQVAVLALFGVTPTMDRLVAANPQSALGGAAGGVVGSAGGSGSTNWEQVNGEQVAMASTDQTTAWVWFHDKTLSMLIVPKNSSDSAHSFLSNYLAVANA